MFQIICKFYIEKNKLGSSVAKVVFDSEFP